MAIDIHCHILPDVDDGVRTMEEAVERIRGEVSGGTRAFVATPHVIDRRGDYRPGSSRSATALKPPAVSFFEDQCGAADEPRRP